MPCRIKSSVVVQATLSSEELLIASGIITLSNIKKDLLSRLPDFFRSFLVRCQFAASEGVIGPSIPPSLAVKGKHEPNIHPVPRNSDTPCRAAQAILCNSMTRKKMVCTYDSISHLDLSKWPNTLL